ncbi:mitochondrial fission regulator 2-like [Hetaerina americana]|uniref:mitochondrial fission regulator 2-like n=1 Tax=Hetaerina americana TaxID=62018 RepID=UPI003A7F4BE6
MELVEIIWDLLSDLINDFLFELNSGLFSLVMHGISVRPTKKYGRHRSLVRWIGTLLPLRPCRRTYSSIFYSENKYGARSTHGFTGLNAHDPPCDFETWSQDFASNAPDVISSIKFSTPKEGILGRNTHSEVSAEKFAALEEQVLQLQAEISKILSAQLINPLQGTKEDERCNGLQIGVAIQKSPRRNSNPSVTTAIGSLVPPPPPPPPMPTFSFPSKPLIRSQSLTDQISQHAKMHVKNECNQHCSSTMPPSMGDILKDLGTVKLRHVERSPGGTPLRRRPLTPPRNDPAALLAAALRRRFAHMRPDDSSPDRTQVINTSSQPSFESMEQTSYSLSPQAINNLGILKI